MRLPRVGATAAFLIAVAVGGGCSEHVSIRSGPSGANAFVNGQAIGTTPVDYAVSRSKLDEHYEVRVDKEGYEPATTTLRTRLAKGRVTGAVFTLGLVAVFRSLYYIEPVFFQLQPVATSSQGDKDRVLGESLRNLQNLYDTGKISEEELRRRQQELLQRRQAP